MARAQRIRSQEGSWSGRQVCRLGLGLGLLCLAPAALALLGFDFGTGVVPVPADGLAGLSRGEVLEAVHLAARGGYTHTLLEWTAFCAAVFVCGLALAQHRLTQESSLPILGVALLCAGAMDAFHTLAADRLIEAVADNRNLIPYTWAICRLFNGAILLAGLVLAARRSSERFPSGAALVVWISVVFVATAYLTIHLSATSATLPQTMFPDEAIRRPYDVYPILPFVLCALVLYFVVLPRRSTAFGQALLLSMIPAVATQLYMAFGSAALHDASFNVSHGLKAVSYAVPLLGLIVEHERTYRRESARAVQIAF